MNAGRALLLDVGNTRLKWGIAENGVLRRTGSVTHEKLAEQGFAVLTTKLPKAIDTAYASNVAGQTFATRLSGVIGLHCGQDVHFARSKASGWGITNRYRQPRRLGVDRFVAMIGARDAYRSSLCIVDAGTAVTIDAVDGKGNHLGGQILPGLRLMIESLNAETSDLPPVRRAARSGDGILQFAASTGSAIVNGSLAAVCGAIERAMKLMRSAKLRPTLVLTGGDASRILAELDTAAEHHPNLVLEGLAVMVRDPS